MNALIECLDEWDIPNFKYTLTDEIDVRKLLDSCEEVDHLQISQFHTIFLPCPEGWNSRKMVMMKSNKKGLPDPVTEEDVRQLPHMLVNNVRVRREFFQYIIDKLSPE